jgi:cytochrome c5
MANPGTNVSRQTKPKTNLKQTPNTTPLGFAISFNIFEHIFGNLPLIYVNAVQNSRRAPLGSRHLKGCTKPAGFSLRMGQVGRKLMRFLMTTVIAAATSLVAISPAAADGQAVYKQACAACHDNLKPKTGDKAVWAPLIAHGEDALVANAIKGKGAMPPRGGHAKLSDADIRAAVEYLIAKSQ